MPRQPKLKKKRKIRIAPRLANGECRVPFGHGLPEPIKEGLRAIAYDEGKSMSWVMEEVIIKFFGFTRPEYVKMNGKKNGRHNS